MTKKTNDDSGYPQPVYGWQFVNPDKESLFAPPQEILPPSPFLPHREECYSTRGQSTRWQTQDAAYLLASKHTAARVFAVICERKSTCDEVEQILEGTHQSISAAINALMNAGFILASGERRLTRSRRQAIVWERWK